MSPDILARIPVPVAPDDSQTISVHIEFEMIPAQGDAPAEMEPRAAIMVDTEGPQPTEQEVWEMAAAWLNGPGYFAAYNRATERLGIA